MINGPDDKPIVPYDKGALQKAIGMDWNKANALGTFACLVVAISR